MNSKLKQLLSLLFMACLIILTGYFILKDQSMATLLETIESVNPLYLLLGLLWCLRLWAVRPLIPSLFCEHLDKKFLILNVLALPSLAFTLAQLPRLPQGANPLKCFIWIKRIFTSHIHPLICSLSLPFTKWSWWFMRSSSFYLTNNLF